MKNYWMLAIIFIVAFFTSACDRLEELKTSLENNEVTIAIGEEINVEVFAKEGLEVTWGNRRSEYCDRRKRGFFCGW